MILFRNDDVLALDKPAGVSMATSAREPAGRAVERLLAACGLPADDALLLVHRLDVYTSGAVLLARNPAAHRALSLAFQERRVAKTYRAVVWGRPRPAAGVIDAPLSRDPKDGRKMRVTPDGKPAVTRYVTRHVATSITDLALQPETGRTHQIRVHLASKGHPIVGDDFYGGATRWRGVKDPAWRRLLREVTRPLLHAERVTVPELGLDVEAPLPDDYARILALLTISSAGPPRHA